MHASMHYRQGGQISKRWGGGGGGGDNTTHHRLWSVLSIHSLLSTYQSELMSQVDITVHARLEVIGSSMERAHFKPLSLILGIWCEIELILVMHTSTQALLYSMAARIL